MKAATEAKLREAQFWCEENDKSVPFMIQYMMDFAGVDHDCVMGFLKTKGGYSAQTNHKESYDKTKISR